MRYLSVCSGIEAATCAWHPLGWTPVGFSEIERFPSAVLAHHYPDVPNLGDMTRFQEWPDDLAPDLIVGGTPCQSFSVAGLRKGLADPRGNLALVYLAMADRYRPEWLVWENVPGVLSSNGGRDFGAFLGGLAELGYGFAYRVLDAQFFGVAQRRRRVFVVANARDWRRAAAVLFERHSLSGHPAPRRETWERIAAATQDRAGCGGAQGAPGAGTWPADVACTLNAAFGSKQGLEDQHALGGGNCSSLPSVAMCLNAGAMGRQDAESETLIPTGGCFDAAYSNLIAFDSYNQAVTGDATQILCSRGTPAIAFGGQMSTPQVDVEMTQTLQAKNPQAVATAMAVRRLTPMECERLQGFPDGYTDIMPNGKPTPDGPRYKALGNSMAVPVMRWIGERIAAVAGQRALPLEAAA